jgi:hypothetical protein
MTKDEEKIYVSGYTMRGMIRELARFYARKTCNSCYGKGVLEMSHPHKGWRWTRACDCVNRNLSYKDIK